MLTTGAQIPTVMDTEFILYIDLLLLNQLQLQYRLAVMVNKENSNYLQDFLD